MLIAGALALVATLADSIRLFANAGDRSALALAAWAIWALALVGPLGLAVQERRRKTPLPPSEAAWKYLVLGYGLAIFALRVIEVCLGRG